MILNDCVAKPLIGIKPKCNVHVANTTRQSARQTPVTGIPRFDPIDSEPRSAVSNCVTAGQRDRVLDQNSGRGISPSVAPSPLDSQYGRQPPAVEPATARFPHPGEQSPLFADPPYLSDRPAPDPVPRPSPGPFAISHAFRLSAFARTAAAVASRVNL